jgi:hypothetical protein
MEDGFEELRRREFAGWTRRGTCTWTTRGPGSTPSRRCARTRSSSAQRRVRQPALAQPHLARGHGAGARRRGARARFFNADPDAYEVVFTLNASGALKLVGEAYPWQPGAASSSPPTTTTPSTACASSPPRTGPRWATSRWTTSCAFRDLESTWPGRTARRKHNLFAFPAQSNFSGVKHPLEWMERPPRTAGTCCWTPPPSSPPAGSTSGVHAPDFVCISFYKMFGFPTGVGVLLARRNALGELHRPWFAGGTVRFVSAQNRLHLRHVTGRGFEDGTLNYLGIAAVSAGLDFLEEIGIERINAHVMGLTRRRSSTRSTGCATPPARRWCASTARRGRGAGAPWPSTSWTRRGRWWTSARWSGGRTRRGSRCAPGSSATPARPSSPSSTRTRRRSAASRR